LGQYGHTQERQNSQGKPSTSVQVAAAYTFTHYCLDAREATDINKING